MNKNPISLSGVLSIIMLCVFICFFGFMAGVGYNNHLIENINIDIDEEEMADRLGDRFFEEIGTYDDYCENVYNVTIKEDVS